MENIFAQAAEFLTEPLKGIIGAFSPVFIGLIIAYTLNPAVHWLETKMSRGWAILITYCSITLALAGLIYGFVVLIIGSIPTEGLNTTIQLISQYFSQWADTVTKFSQTDFTLLKDVISQISSYILTVVLGIIASIYLLIDKNFFLRIWNSFLSLILPQKIHGQACEIWGEIDEVLRTFIKGAFVDSIIVAFLSAAVLTALKIDFAVIIGIVGGLLNIIPYFGPFFGMIPAFIAGLFGGGILHGAAAVGGLFIIQQIDCNIIYPKIVGKSTGLHPLYVLISVSVAGKYFGIIGMLLAVPAAGVIQIFIKKWAYK